jgi:hypothetical protein
MILTPISPDDLAGALDRFGVGLGDAASRRVFHQIRATSPQRAEGPEAERHRLAALALARNCGMAVHPPGTRCVFNWDGVALNGATEAYVILHEIAHFMLAPPERRGLVDFGLGPGPDTINRDTAERAAMLPPLARAEEEAEASLLGIVWEARLVQPALASFLDQNWLEGLERSAASHFSNVVAGLRLRELLLGPLPRSAAGVSGISATLTRPRGKSESGQAAAGRPGEQAGSTGIEQHAVSGDADR